MEEDVVDAFVNGLFANMVTRRQGKIAEILIQAEELFDGPDSIAFIKFNLTKLIIMILKLINLRT